MTKFNNIKEQVKRLREEINYHDRLYYQQNNPEISDREYDKLMRQLQQIEQKYPQLITPDSPTQRVGSDLIEAFPTVKHRRKMFSLDNTYSRDEVLEWVKRVRKNIGTPQQELSYFVELKIDGVSCSLTYQNSHLVLGATRGDGESGEDVTTNIRTIRAIPLTLIGSGHPPLIEIRGEIYINKSDFGRINKDKQKNNESPFANPRNAASGSLKLLDPKIVNQRHLKFWAHSFGWVEDREFNSQQQFLTALKTWGLPINPYNRHFEDIKQVLDYFDYCQQQRENLDYEVDGLVIKVNSFNLQKKLGFTSKFPRWAVAYKFPAHQVTTKIKGVEFGVGRSGIITPIAILEPTQCAGVTISRATLHNFDQVKRLDIRINDTVLVERAGDVIPKIVKVIKSQRPSETRAIKVPQSCPVCNSKVVKRNEQDVYWYCINPDCPAQLKGSLLHFASRGAMDIEGVGESLVEELVERNLVNSLADIYKLRVEDLLKLPLFKKKKAHNIIAAIEDSKQQSLSRFLFGLGIPYIGQRAANILARNFKNIDDFFKASQQDFQQLNDIGEIMAESLVDFFRQPQVKKMIERFKQYGLNLNQLKEISSNKLQGKRFVFTGSLVQYSRQQAQAAVEAAGGSFSSSVSKKTDFVVAGKDAGSKLDKAKELGVEIIDEDQFRKILKE